MVESRLIIDTGTGAACRRTAAPRCFQANPIILPALTFPFTIHSERVGLRARLAAFAEKEGVPH
jgi:hypothetical protein